MTEKYERAKELAKVLESQGILMIGPEGEILVNPKDEARVSEALVAAGFGLVRTTEETTKEGYGLFKIVVAPRSIKEIVDAVVVEDQKIKLEPALRSVVMNMIAFD